MKGHLAREAFLSAASPYRLRRAIEPRFNSALKFRLRATGISPTAPAQRGTYNHKFYQLSVRFSACRVNKTGI